MRFIVCLPIIAALFTLACQLPLFSISVIGIGAPIVDIIYRVDNEFLKDNALRKGDSQIAETWERFDLVIKNAEVNGYAPTVNTGGSCSNTIKGLAALDNQTAFFGKIGNDVYGDYYKGKIAALGIKPLLIASPIPTSQVTVYITEDHQRSFLSYFGAGQAITADEIDTAMFEEAPLVHFEGYLLDDLVFTEKAMKLAKERGCKISLDLGCIRIVKSYGKEILRLVKNYVDIVFSNEDEIKTLLNQSPKEGCKTMANICPIAIVQIGKDGCWVCSEGEVFSSRALVVKAIDTNGAGDLFASGFLHGYMKGWDLRECAWLGNLLGGTVVTVTGAEIPNEMWPEIKTTIEDKTGKKR